MLKIKNLAVGLCIVFILTLFSAIPVYGAVSINILQGTVDQTVTISGLTVGDSFEVQWDRVVYVDGIVPSTGRVSFNIPESKGGSHTLEIKSTSVTKTWSFTVLPSISINPVEGIVGTSVSVSGKGFAASESDIKVIFSGNNVKTGVSANSKGTWSTTFNVPASTTGTKKVDASGATTSAADVDDVNFSVKPSIDVSPKSCGVGCPVTVKGSGFVGSETGIKLTFDGSEIKTGINADSNGSWSVTFNVPSTYSGSHTIDASGSSTSASDIDNVSFTVISAISIDKTTASVGDVISVTGTGFASNEKNIYITFDGATQGAKITADDSGQWKVSLTIPAATYGKHVVDAYGDKTAAASIEDKNMNIQAKITLNPAEGNVGDTINVEGTGFSGQKAVKVLYGTVEVITNVSTNNVGSFKGSFKAPKGIGGNIEVKATDAGNISATATFAMDKIAPSMPLIKSPKSGETVGFVGDTRVDFKWGAVTDPSGVVYDIQVATDSDFKGIVFEHSGIPINEYNSIDTEKLPLGKYYWRVRAVDGANNASDWTLATQFKSGFISLTTLIIIIVAIVVVFIIYLRARAVFSKKH